MFELRYSVSGREQRRNFFLRARIEKFAWLYAGRNSWKLHQTFTWTLGGAGPGLWRTQAISSCLEHSAGLRTRFRDFFPSRQVTALSNWCRVGRAPVGWWNLAGLNFSSQSPDEERRKNFLWDFFRRRRRRQGRFLWGLWNDDVVSFEKCQKKFMLTSLKRKVSHCESKSHNGIHFSAIKTLFT